MLAQLKPDGTFGANATEMTCYHKAVYLMGLAGQLPVANRMLDHLKRQYLQVDNDFKISSQRKVNKVNYNELIWGYSKVWFAIVAHRIGRFDISYPAYQYLQDMYDTDSGGFTSTPHLKKIPTARRHSSVII